MSGQYSLDSRWSPILAGFEGWFHRNVYRMPPTLTRRHVFSFRGKIGWGSHIDILIVSARASFIAVYTPQFSKT